MSYVALATDFFDEVARFYGDLLGFPIVTEWDRANGHARRFDLGGMRLEILDNGRERRPLRLGDPAERIHLVIEVPDIEAAYRRVAVFAPAPEATSWGSKLFRIKDPDGNPITFVQWDKPPEDGP